MKNIVVLFVIAINLLLPTSAITAEALSETDALKKQLDKVQNLQLQHALIKNEADLKFYQAITYPGFPLNVFSSEHVRQDFLDSIKFSEKGMSRFNPDTLSTLDFDDAYGLLALFGQSYLAEHYAAPDTSTEHGLVKTPYLSNAEYPLLAKLRGIDSRDDSDLDRKAAFRGFYDNTLIPELAAKDCSNRGHNETLALLEILYIINFYSSDKEVANRHLTCFEGYVKQFSESKYIAAVASDVYKSLLSSRQLDAANQLQQQYPEMQVGKLPIIKGLEIDGPSVYQIKADTKTLIQKAFTFKAETEVIVIAHPYCQFCQLLIKDIVADKVLSGFFKQHSRWIANQDYLDHIDGIVAWNKDYSMAKFEIAYLKQDFTQLDEWATPAIYFLKDGQVLDKLIGWPETGRKDALMAYIEKYFPNFE